MLHWDSVSYGMNKFTTGTGRRFMWNSEAAKTRVTDWYGKAGGRTQGRVASPRRRICLYHRCHLLLQRHHRCNTLWGETTWNRHQLIDVMIHAITISASFSGDLGEIEWTSKREYEWMQQIARAKQAARRKQMSERNKLSSERTSE